VYKRQQLVNAFILVDINIPPQKLDIDMMNWMGGFQIPFTIIFTKGDRISATKRALLVEKYNERLLEDWSAVPPQFVSAAHSGLGREEILGYIDDILKNV